MNYQFSNHDQCLKPISGLFMQIKNKDTLPLISPIKENEIWFSLIFEKNCDLSKNSLVVKIPSHIRTYNISINDKIANKLVSNASSNDLLIWFNESKVKFNDGINTLDIRIYPSKSFSRVYQLLTEEYVGIDTIVFSYSELSYLCGESCFQVIAGNLTSETSFFSKNFLRSITFKLTDKKFVFSFNPQYSLVVAFKTLLIGITAGITVSIINTFFEGGKNSRKKPEL
jgi:hypothetical protein